eukprot:TRINITY_DN8003_c0_g1_i2.p1 TRINITY_DN8003_c0_g1~~TRINITY_DN8003_c0_g1_i2.p1  ORF type:complete len:164 (+),score=36.44 TRINITY_DN8003_c0_g1_i2:61-552(+)
MCIRDRYQRRVHGETDTVHLNSNIKIVERFKSQLEENIASKLALRLPSFSTDYLYQNGHNSQIVKLQLVNQGAELISLECMGKVIFWTISDGNFQGNEIAVGGSKVKLIQTMTVNIPDLPCIRDEILEANLISSDFALDTSKDNNVFVCTSCLLYTSPSPRDS